MSTNLGAQGHRPELQAGAGNPEALKYGRLWERPEYRKVAPGEELAMTFLQQARPRAGAHVLDFGCGTGRGAMMLALLGNVRVTMIDFVRNCLDPEVREALTTQAHALTFLKADLEQPIPIVGDYGYCTDVLEHIPPDRVGAVLTNVLLAAQHVFFSIATVPDSCGALIGEELHLTVRPGAWWLSQFAALGCLVHWSEEQPGRLLVYVSSWQTGRAVADAGVLNTADQEIRANVAHNIRQGWFQLYPHAANPSDVMILGGGPTLTQFEDAIRAHRAAGVKLITLNGAYGWCLERGLIPSAQIVVDARAFNARFTHPVVDGCKYLLASQCHPDVFEGLPKERTFLWHASPVLIKDLLEAQYPDWWFCVPGGSTALLRAIPLLRMLGYRRFHLYGCDSCLDGAEAHHAYAQPENDGGRVIPILLNTPDGSAGRVFYGHPWMISQATEFIDLIRAMGDEIDLEIHGDGLLRYILETGAQIADTREGG